MQNTQQAGSDRTLDTSEDLYRLMVPNIHYAVIPIFHKWMNPYKQNKQCRLQHINMELLGIIILFSACIFKKETFLSHPFGYQYHSCTKRTFLTLTPK